MNDILGVRAEQAAVHWAIVQGTLIRPILHAHGSEVAPESYNEGESLVWIRKRLVYIIDTFKPISRKYSAKLMPKIKLKVPASVSYISSNPQLGICEKPTLKKFIKNFYVVWLSVELIKEQKLIEMTIRGT